ALVEATNTAQAERAAARAELDNAPPAGAITEADVYAMIDSLGDVAAAINSGKQESLAEAYAASGLQVCYEPETSTAELSIRVNSACVRGGKPTRPRGIPAQCRYSCHEATRAGVPVAHAA